MGYRLSYSRGKSMRVTSLVTSLITSLVTSRRTRLVFFWVALTVVTNGPWAAASNAPDWMRALVGVTLPSYDEKTNAVLLYSETDVTVLSADKIRKRVREAYKVLRPEGRERGTVSVYVRRRRIGFGRQVQNAARSGARSGKHHWV